ncbi:winged helix-turn-helix domain-containing protein [Roseateles sp.]|uniref:winged helix-turn-helix domain-containing protein n=1 Tax=Roseateles sp. TaxID=1971397 RepID=UPI0025F94668|nr:winged helix-turn-helix domain-containing protein [Roseateles sp.]MBV8036619.1 winged helix-turn-helix domain-containing protein [Roseateles sp.]
MSIQGYRFGDFILDLRRGSLSRGDVDIPLRPKSFDLLTLLVRDAGRLQSKQDLMDALWPDVVVTDDSLTRCVSDVRAALGEAGPRMLQTVARRGYRFVEPVQALPAEADAGRPARWRRHWSLAAAATLLLAAAGAAWWARPAPPRLSVLVLPFATLDAPADTAFLGDVLASDLTGALTRLRGTSVIAAASARTLRGRPWDPLALGREWGVRHVLSGSIARSGAGWRISAQLVDTGSGASLWADRFDIDGRDPGQALDGIVLRLANALGVELLQAAARQAPRDPQAADAEELAMRCEAATFTRSDQSAMPDFAACEQALRRDPRNVRALVVLAYFHAARVSRVQSPDPRADLAIARHAVDLALAAAPDEPKAHCAQAVVLEGEHRLAEAVTAAERCLALNPSDARAHRILATLHFFLAQPEQTLAFAERGLRLSPRDPEISTFLLFKGWAHFMLGQTDAALHWLRQADAAAPRAPTTLAALASQLALDGQQQAARDVLARYLALPETRARSIAQWDYRPDGSPAFVAFDARFKEGLRRAGLPER